MTRRHVLIVYADGHYRIRQFPTEEGARCHAQGVCAAFPDATVQHGSHLLQRGRPDELVGQPGAST